MNYFLRDLRCALRMTAKSPSFSVVAIITLALGIGATVASFSLLGAVLWHWLPYHDLDQLVGLAQAEAKTPASYMFFSGRDYLAIRSESRSYSDLAAEGWGGIATLRHGGPPQAADVESVSVNYFPMVGLKAALGRLFKEEDQKSSSAAVAVLTYEEWRKEFASDPRIVGTSVMLDDKSRTIIGVLPRQYRGDNADILIPIQIDSASFLDPKLTELFPVGRLLPGRTIAEAKAELDRIIAGREAAQDQKSNPYISSVRPLAEYYGIENYKPRLILFIGVAALVLLTACVNVANLLLARSVERQMEFAVRNALGAGRWQLIRQFLAEGLVLAAFAATAGVVLATWGLHALTIFANPAAAGVIPETALINVDGRALAFAVAVASLTTIVFGIAPAFLAARVDPDRWLKSAGRSQTGSRTRQRLRNALVVTEVAVALVLTLAGALFATSLRNLEEADLGFNPHHLLTIHLWLRGSRYEKPNRVAQFYDDLVQRVRAIPGVQSAVVADMLPMIAGHLINFSVVGGAPLHSAGLPSRPALQWLVGPDFFHILGIPLIRGRGIGTQDTATSQRVAVINENLAHRYFGSGDPIGRQLKLELHSVNGHRQEEVAEIVGIAHNVHEVAVNEPAFESIYFPFEQDPDGFAFVAVRTSLRSQDTLRLIQKEIASLDPTQPLLGLPTMAERVSQGLAGDRFNTTAITTLSLIGLLLALAGVYAVIAYTVSQRVHEIGIRMALGAKGNDVLGWIVGRSCKFVLGGVAAGIAAALIIGRLLGSSLYLVEGQHGGMLYGITLHDPLTLAAAAVVLAVTAVAASYVPARRATKVDPIEALRCE